MTTPEDHALARDLAAEAGQLLLALRAGGGDPDVLRKAGDRQSHEFLAAQLADRRPGDALLSEEGVDGRERLSADRVWIVDPLDGTREFGEAGRSDWAVHVALWERGELTAGAVALPAQGTTLNTLVSGADGKGRHNIGPVSQPYLPGGQPPVPPGQAKPVIRTPSADSDPARPLRLVVSRSRASQLVKDVAALLLAELVPCGSAGAKAATVITGETDVYLHSGGFYEWDTAAPVAVARAAGLHCSRIDGTDLAYNQENPYLPDILITRPAHAGLLLDAIREVTNGH